MNQCVYCEKTTDLNTQMTVSLKDGNKMTVQICDEHAEEASVKSARQAYEAKQEKIKQFLEQAKALGITVQEESGGIILASGSEKKPKSNPHPKPSSPQIVESENLDGEDIIDTTRLDSGRIVQSIGGSTEFGAVASHSSLEVSGQQDRLPDGARKGKAKMELTEGREGMPLAIPSKRVDGTGTTRIKVAKIEDDHRLQKRFKNMARDSMNDKTPDFARSGYQNTTATCTFCRGEGYVKQRSGTIDCPKCHGSGLLSVY